MGRRRREEYRTQTYSDIKKAARTQMAHYGTAGITLRGIARELGMTAPALYHYFSSLDELITSLVIDAFESLASTMQEASTNPQLQTISAKTKATMLAYRGWALMHPIDFQLIFGNPIPGYAAPAEITTPLARRPFETLLELIVEGWESGEFHIPPDYESLPETILNNLQVFQQSIGNAIPPGYLYFLIVSWSRGHGMVMLELFEHSTQILGDTAAFYEFEVDRLLQSLQAHTSQAN